MRSLAGCPPKRVIEAQQRPTGAMLTLECGHGLWVAGFPAKRPIPDCFRIGCQSSPCYRPQRYMGR